MTYATGQKIQSTDYNSFVGATTSNSSGVINSIWSVGNGNSGYGQSSNLANVSVGTKVTANQWNSLLFVVNKISDHQTNANSNVTLLQPNLKISFRSNLVGTLSNLYNNRLTAFNTGSFANYDQTVSMLGIENQAVTANIAYSVQFANVDAARYFFNAGGYLNLEYLSFTNSLGNPRGDSIGTLVQTNFVSKNMRSNSFGARTGSGGTLVTDVTTGTAGYYGINTTPTTKIRIDSAGYFSSDYFLVDYSNSGGAGLNNGNGNIVNLNVVFYSGTIGSTEPTDDINITVGMRLVVVEPETDNLSNSWGTVTVIKSSSP